MNSRVAAAVFVVVVASFGAEATRTLQSTCTVKLSAGLDAIAGYTDLTLAHNCEAGFARTLKVEGELTDLYQ